MQPPVHVPLFLISVEETSTTWNLWDPALADGSGLVDVLALMQICLPEQPSGPGRYRAGVLLAATSTDAGCWELASSFLVDGGK